MRDTYFPAGDDPYDETSPTAHPDARPLDAAFLSDVLTTVQRRLERRQDNKGSRPRGKQSDRRRSKDAG